MKTKKPSTFGTGEKLKQWTREEDSALGKIFLNFNFRGRHADNIGMIQNELSKEGISRTKKAISHRMSRLGIKFYSVKKGHSIEKCTNCKNLFQSYTKLLNRTKNPQTLCYSCQKIRNRRWDIEHNEEKKQYLKDYFKRFKMLKGVEHGN